jgi:DNA-binding NtrC family response regulator
MVELVLGDPVEERVQRLLPALEQEMTVRRVTDLAELRRWCQGEQAPVVALPLAWERTLARAGLGTDSPLLAFLREEGRRLSAVVYAALGRLPLASYCRALAAGACRVVDEEALPPGQALRDAVLPLVEARRAQAQEQEQQREVFGRIGLIGGSPALQEVFRRVLKASRLSNFPVLIRGERGTGKRRLAEAIHLFDSRRNQQPLFRIDCSAAGRPLAESGAGTQRQDFWQEVAGGGTLLLEEIDRLEDNLQSRLLEALRQVQRAEGPAADNPGGAVRLIATACTSLEDRVMEGTFSGELYRQLQGLQIRIPPLRERPEDITAQARYFLKALQQGREQQLLDLEPQVLKTFAQLPWEGNTHQLEHLLREVLAHKEGGGLVEVADLPPSLLEKRAPAPPRDTASELEAMKKEVHRLALTLNEAVAECERQWLRCVLEEQGRVWLKNVLHLIGNNRSD